MPRAASRRTLCSSSSSSTAAAAAAVQRGRTLAATNAAVHRSVLNSCTLTMGPVAKSVSHRATVTWPFSEAPSISCHRGSVARELRGRARSRLLVRRSTGCRRTGGSAWRTGNWRTAKTPLRAARLTGSGVSATFAAVVSGALPADSAS
ncbi:hypothetical protein TTRE_0000863501 [Trichuris trichiura]|uniref:Uncharacterized protein n=1 Tax=Trichuris trichiura TaxID=36087 RepID=A0A077ZIQ3_TRITR|nr:hypothetical protein TTRE_0000863501 [Trichuris trichiura]